MGYQYMNGRRESDGWALKVVSLFNRPQCLQPSLDLIHAHVLRVSLFYSSGYWQVPKLDCCHGTLFFAYRRPSRLCHPIPPCIIINASLIRALASTSAARLSVGVEVATTHSTAHLPHSPTETVRTLLCDHRDHGDNTFIYRGHAQNSLTTMRDFLP
jgi:hypothetical protein